MFTRVLKVSIKKDFFKKNKKVKVGQGSLRSFGFWVISITEKIFCQSWSKFNWRYAGGTAFCQLSVGNEASLDFIGNCRSLIICSKFYA